MTEVTLKSGNIICIRKLEVSEASKLLELKRNYINDTNSIPLTLQEYPLDIEKEEALIAKYNHSKNSILLVAEYKGELIGNIDLTGSDRFKMAHTAMIGMGIKEEWRNKGLGTALIQSVLNAAKENQIIKLIWLDVYANNQLGINLYRKMGFVVSGVIKNFFKEENGFQDKLQMYLNLD